MSKILQENTLMLHKFVNIRYNIIVNIYTFLYFTIRQGCDMMYIPKVERLRINYKTLEEFKKFKGCGAQELSMLEDLQANMIENDSESPFYGMYFGESLVARMSLYKQQPSETFQGPYVELFKLEVLPTFQKKGFGKALVNYAKSLQLPIKTTPRVHSAQFWEHLGFERIVDGEETFYVFYPQTNLNTVTKGESA
ncbi:N-acetyltransferase [Microbacteriaceae bacterium 4G12]